MLSQKLRARAYTSNQRANNETISQQSEQTGVKPRPTQEKKEAGEGKLLHLKYRIVRRRVPSPLDT